jgi:DNA-binding SARP family transcriptional activator
MESPRLRILLLGPPVITWDGVPVKITRQQIRLLLYYLAAQWQPVQRSTICQVFWSEKDDASGRKLLREALSKLRAELPDPDVLVTQAGDVFLDPEKVYVDGIEFKHITDPLLASAEISRDAVLPGWMYSEMRKALALCRGDLKLEGVGVGISRGYEDFLSLSSQSYDYVRLKIEERLASHCIAIGALDEAILWTSKALEIDPLNDDNNFLVINCLRESGRTKDALDYIDYLENLYSHASGQKLPDSIVMQRTRIRENHDVVQKDISEWLGIESHPVPFVGREDLLERLRNALNRKGIVSIRGSSGVGKNRFLEEFYINLQRKPRLVFCSGKPLVRCAPFEPIIEGLRRAVRPEEWMELPDFDKATLQQFFPNLINSEKASLDLNGLSAGKDEFLQICESLHQLLILLAKKRPLLFIVDIIIWCDDATLDFIGFLADRNYFQKYGLLVLNSRKEESSLKFEQFVDRNLVKGQLEIIEIPALSKEETNLLIQKMVGFNVTDCFLDKFYNDTGGNPYFLVEGLKSLLSLDFDFENYSKASLYPIPNTIKALISEKTRDLTVTAFSALQAGAVLGQFFMPAVVEAMSVIPQTDMISAFEELERFGLVSVRENPELGLGYFFDHNQVREVILSEMSPLRKRHLHLLAVNASIKVYGNRPEFESQYAYHFEEAGDFVSAFKSWLLAAEFSRTRFSTSDRYTAYDRASKLVSKLPPDAVVENLYMLTNAWANLAYDLSDVDKCESIYNLCLEYGEQIQSPLLLGTAWSGIGRVLGMKMQLDEGIEAIKRAQFYINRTDILSEKIEVLCRLGILNSLANKITEAVVLYEQALELLPGLKDEQDIDAKINVLSQLGLLYVEIGWPQKSVEVGEQAVNLSLLVKRRSAKVQAALTLASGYYYTGNYDKSLQTAQAVYQLAEKLNLRWWLSGLDVIMAKNYLVIGNMDACMDHFQLALKREKENLGGRVFRMACVVGGEMYRLYGDFKNARKMYLMGMDPDNPDIGIYENEMYYCITLIAERKLVEARDRLRKIVEITNKLNLMMVCLPAKMLLSSITPENELLTIGIPPIENIVKDMISRNFMVSKVYGMGLQAQLELVRGNQEAARTIYRSIHNDKMTQASIWMRIISSVGLYKSSTLDSEKKEYKTEIHRCLTILGEKSTLPQLRRLYLSYRKKTITSL